MKKTINEITLYDLSKCETEVWLWESTQTGLNLEIENEEGQKFEEIGFHKRAAEGLADFCKSYLRTYERLQKNKDN